MYYIYKSNVIIYNCLNSILLLNWIKEKMLNINKKNYYITWKINIVLNVIGLTQYYTTKLN